MTKYINVEDACIEVDRGDLLVGNNAEWAKEIICRTRPANVREIRQGQWLEVRDKFGSCLGVKCSECSRRVRNHGEHFCPNCGAEMQRKEDRQ
jgi:hypothetical protein